MRNIYAILTLTPPNFAPWHGRITCVMHRSRHSGALRFSPPRFRRLPPVVGSGTGCSSVPEWSGSDALLCNAVVTLGGFYLFLLAVNSESLFQGFLGFFPWKRPPKSRIITTVIHGARIFLPHICPFCPHQKLAPSRKRKPADFFMLLIGQAPYRCPNCLKRFYRSVKEQAQTVVGGKEGEPG